MLTLNHVCRGKAMLGLLLVVLMVIFLAPPQALQNRNLDGAFALIVGVPLFLYNLLYLPKVLQSRARELVAAFVYLALCIAPAWAGFCCSWRNGGQAIQRSRALMLSSALLSVIMVLYGLDVIVLPSSFIRVSGKGSYETLLEVAMFFFPPYYEAYPPPLALRYAEPDRHYWSYLKRHLEAIWTSGGIHTQLSCSCTAETAYDALQLYCGCTAISIVLRSLLYCGHYCTAVTIVLRSLLY